MAEAFDLYAQIKKAENNYNAAVAKNKEISQKIERLEQARRYVRYAHSDAEKVVSEISGFDVPDNLEADRRCMANQRECRDVRPRCKEAGSDENNEIEQLELVCHEAAVSSCIK